MRMTVMMLSGALLVIGLAGASAFGQDAADPAATEGGLRWFDFFVLKGGYITLLLIALSVVTIALTVEHALSIRRKTIAPLEVADEIRDHIEQQQYLEAVQYTADDPSMMGYVINAALVEAGNGFDAMQRALYDALDERAARLFRKIEYLHTIGNVSPMIGLFGTVYGMILLFAEIHQSNTFPEPQVVADRISVALITTFWGLAVAIPALSIFALFRNRIDVLTAECALASERLLAVFKGDRTGGGLAAGRAPERSR